MQGNVRGSKRDELGNNKRADEEEEPWERGGKSRRMGDMGEVKDEMGQGWGGEEREMGKTQRRGRDDGIRAGLGKEEEGSHKGGERGQK